jgi:hypothetical protein
MSASTKENRERSMFGCTAAALDEALAEDTVEWTVSDHEANTIRQLINIAKYAIDKAVPR